MKDQEKIGPGLAPLITRRKFLLGGAVIGTGLLGDGFFRQPTSLEIRQVRLPVQKIPTGKSLRIVHLSDLHLHRFSDYFERVALETNELRPDLILLTGDYVEEERNLTGVLEFLRRLKAPAGVFAVQGNWEYWALIEGERLQRSFAEVGVNLLIDQRADVNWNGMPISLLGIDFPSASGSLQRLVDSADTDRVNVTLSHVPAFQHEILAGKSDLILCGHTHGGQVRLPFVKPFHLPRHSGDFVDGLYHVGATRLPIYVSRGIGTSIMPVRFFCPPEICLIELYGV